MALFHLFDVKGEKQQPIPPDFMKCDLIMTSVMRGV